MICDTSFLIDLLRGKDLKAKQKAELLDKKLIPKAVTTVTVMELWRGALKAIKSEKEKKKVNELLESLLVYTFSIEDAKAAAEIEAHLSKTQCMIDLEDIMIAGVSKARNESVLTRNVKHFEKVVGLEVEKY
jgi:tRNA(fMet)-specific endonuclease VapC